MYIHIYIFISNAITFIILADIKFYKKYIEILYNILMYIHLLKFEELPDNIYKIILTSDDIDTTKTIHEIFYTIENVFTYNVDDLQYDTFTNFLELMSNYKNNKNFIYCYDIDKFEQLTKCILELDENIEYVSTENTPLKLTRKDSKKIYNIIKYFIEESNKEHLFISPDSLKNLKNFDEKLYKIYLDDNSSIHCIDIDKDIEIVEGPTYYITILDKHIYLSESKDNFIEIDGNISPNNLDRFKNLTSKEINMYIDTPNIFPTSNTTPSKIFNVGTKSTPLMDIRKYSLAKPSSIADELVCNIVAYDKNEMDYAPITYEQSDISRPDNIKELKKKR
jgi:hypothetical protein